jgi:hypothetical protein
VIWRHVTLAGYAAVVSTVAIIIAGGSLLYTKRSYDFNVAKEQRELKDKEPAFDVQVRPAGISNLSVTISITNRGDIDIWPLNIVVENSPDAGTLYFSNDRQSINKLSSSLSLSSMGPIESDAVWSHRREVRAISSRGRARIHRSYPLR